MAAQAAYFALHFTAGGIQSFAQGVQAARRHVVDTGAATMLRRQLALAPLGITGVAAATRSAPLARGSDAAIRSLNSPGNHGR